MSNTHSLKLNLEPNYYSSSRVDSPRKIYSSSMNLTGQKSNLWHTTYQKLEVGIEQLSQGKTHSDWNTIKGTGQPNTNSPISFADI